MDKETLLLYCDLIPDPTLLNRDHPQDPFVSRHKFIGQHILDVSTQDLDKDNFTVSPHIEITTLDLTERTWSVRLFEEGHLPGHHSLIAIGLMGGWTPDKLKHIWHWLNGPDRRFALTDQNCKIIIDYSLEGFTELVFPDFWNWIYENELDDRVVYVSSSINVATSYKEWCIIHGKRPNMQCIWSGFFAKNIYSSLPHAVYHEGRHQDPDYRLNYPLEHDDVISRLNQHIDRYNYHPGVDNRVMCLNRRPHIHRLLMTIVFKRAGIIPKMSISFPKDFNEPEQWLPPNYDKTKRQWSVLKGHMAGHADHLENDFHDLYNNILPLIVDRDDFGTNHAHNLNIRMYCKHPVNVITETLAFDSSVFFSEKIWKPMLVKQIFLLWSSPFYLKWLRSLGFRTFEPFVNEDYDLIVDDLDRAEAIAKECKRIINLAEYDFLTLVKNCQPIVEHNQRLVTSRFFMVETCQREVIKYIKNLGRN